MPGTWRSDNYFHHFTPIYRLYVLTTLTLFLWCYYLKQRRAKLANKYSGMVCAVKYPILKDLDSFGIDKVKMSIGCRIDLKTKACYALFYSWQSCAALRAIIWHRLHGIWSSIRCFCTRQILTQYGGLDGTLLSSAFLWRLTLQSDSIWCRLAFGTICMSIAHV